MREPVVGSRLASRGIAALMCFFVRDAQAGAAGGSVASSATVLPACRSLSIEPMTFGNYDPAASAVANATFTVQCSQSTPVIVTLDRGTAPGASILTRRLTDGRGNALSYQLYTTADRTAVWGDGTTGSVLANATGKGLGSDLRFTVYGVIPAGQSLAVPGRYTDSIVITIDY